MIAIPAVDLKGGRCVQLVGGRPEEERVSLPDPVAVATRWRAEGFEALHVVDLDAALGTGDNASVIEDIVRVTDAEVQVGGGVRSDDRAESLLRAGVRRVVVGTRALDDPEWFAMLAGRWPGRIVVALDTRDGRILRKGWTEETALLVEEYLPRLAPLPLAGVLSTDVGREGRLQGIDREACQRVIDVSPHPVCVSGGVTSTAELEFLAQAGAASVVLGMAIYTGTLDTKRVAARWGAATRTENGTT